MNDSNLVPLDQMLLTYPRVDLLKIAELKSFDRTGKLFSDLVAIFEEEFRKNIPVMRKFLAEGELEDLSKLAHRLRSTGYNSGASRVSEILKKIEIDSVEPDVQISELQILLKSLDAESVKTFIELEKLK